MTKEVLGIKIGQLKIKRWQAHNNPAEQARIQKLLDKLEEKWYLMLEQEGK